MAEHIDLKARYKFSGDVFNALLKADIDMKTAITICNDIPNADVAEVRHGEWLAELVDEMGGVKLLAGLERIKHTCSACGFAHKLPVPWRLTWNYCPNCGCKMDGKGEGE